MLRYCLMNLVVFSLLTSSGFAQEKIPTSSQLKEKGIALLKAAEVKEPQAVETANLVVIVGLPEAKAKTLSESLEKTYAFAAKGLKLDPREDDKEAKLSIYVFPNLDAFHSYIRSALKRRPEKDETFTMDTKAVTPFIAVTPKRGETNVNYETLVGDQISGALLQRKGGNAVLTEWMRDGFARAVAMRMNSGIASADRGAVRRIAPPVAKTAKTHTCVVDKAWSGMGKEKEQVAACLMDFLVFGSGNAKLGNILSGLTPSDENRDPTFARALMSAEWKVEDLDKEWRDWLGKGSPAGK
jgi:hypothetical protein